MQVFEVIHPCCCGLDVHKETVVACVRRVAAGGVVEQEVATYCTTTADCWHWATGWWGVA